MRYFWQMLLVALHRDHADSVRDAAGRWRVALAERDAIDDERGDLEAKLANAERLVASLTSRLEDAQLTIREHEATIRIQDIEAKGVSLVVAAQNERLREFIAKSATLRPSYQDRTVEPFMTS